ncbi:MAG TPA: hypothetical protein VH684_15830 [Xanthobacteraceae bacterium]|jgi:hypothetical protein
MRKGFACFLQSMLLVTCANAQSAVVRDFGLLGEWASECSRPPSPANEHSLFALASSGAIWVLNNVGPYYDGMVYRIVEAERIGSDKLSMRQVLTTDEAMVLDVVVLKDNEKIRVWSSHTAGGDTLVKDGIASPTNRKTRWATRCGERWALD